MQETDELWDHPENDIRFANMADDERFDAFLTTLGFGRWQLRALLATTLVMSTFPIHLVGSPFLAAPMPFRCFDGGNASVESEGVDPSGAPNGTFFSDACAAAADLPPYSVECPARCVPSSVRATELRTCPFIEYDTSLFTSTVTSDFDLVCERAWLRPLYVTLYMIGGLLGSLAGGYVGDRWGRRRAVQLASLTNALTVIATVFSPSYPLVLVMRVLAGITMTSMVISGWSLSLECCPCKYRGLLGMLLGLPYSVSVICCAGIAYLIRTWQFLFLASASPVLILLPISFLMDESPRWLLQKGRVDEARVVLQRAVQLNNAEKASSLHATIEKLIEVTATDKISTRDGEQKTSSVVAALLETWAYIRTPAMCKIIIATAILWFLHNNLYLGVALNANNFSSDDPFLYVALTGVMDGSAILATTPLTAKLGRRVLVWAGFAVGGVFFLAELLVPEDFSWVKWIFVMGGFFLIAGSLQVNYMYAPELFPTESRARGFAFVQLAGNVGSACAPLVTDVVSQYAWWAAGVTFGCAGIVGSFLLPLLPETRNQPLPETLEDVQNRGRKKREDTSRGAENAAYVTEGESSGV
ncbi:solute carrier family 22 member 6-like isoform X2 [Penaeus chinensis]|uniref:solute carrier family 22 member 6-like isoform X2 n=1 Tax=Penaeus chinensis TaxID=139456 RepID=UPI001FB74994|nr:solute carrier family 22 member 6-like isoform X2 [Penaeus chinensis]